MTATGWALIIGAVLPLAGVLFGIFGRLGRIEALLQDLREGR